METEVDWRDGEPLARIAAQLAPARVRVVYPGVWLREDVYAIHGHYADRHTTVPMFERLGAGAMARLIREPAIGPGRPEDYERVQAPLYAWLDAMAQHGGRDLGTSSHGASVQAMRALGGSSRRGRWRRRGMRLAFPMLVGALNRARIGPLSTDISGPQLRGAPLRAMGEVLGRLQLAPPVVIFGHTHRAGPLARDDRSEWRTPAGTRLINSGCWVHEPGFLGPRPGESPYRSGFAVRFDGDGAPELVNLLDGVSRRAPG